MIFRTKGSHWRKCDFQILRLVCFVYFRLKRYAGCKEALEAELYSRFVLVLNEKKAKIRSLQERITHLQETRYTTAFSPVLVHPLTLWISLKLSFWIKTWTFQCLYFDVVQGSSLSMLNWSPEIWYFNPVLDLLLDVLSDSERMPLPVCKHLHFNCFHLVLFKWNSNCFECLNLNWYFTSKDFTTSLYIYIISNYTQLV